MSNEAYWDQIAARERSKALDWMRQDGWWTWDCSYPWCDLPRIVCAGAITLDEVVATVPEEWKAPMRQTFEANMALNGCRGPWDGTPEYRRAMLSSYDCGPPGLWRRFRDWAATRLCG
jgi:hypothetical protein